MAIFQEKVLLKRLLTAIGAAPVRIVLNGEEVGPRNVPPVATVQIEDLWTLVGLLADPEVGFGDAYADGRIKVDGDLVRLLEAVYESRSGTTEAVSWYSRLYSKWLELRQDNGLRGSRDNIHHHYDLGNDFYKLWLDQEMLYTCAYFPAPSATLEEAQLAKMDHVCRKLRLQPGETVVEAGCGWGALALYMAREYGVSVKAFNVSREQIEFARDRAHQEGLAHQVDFIEDDYRNVSGKFDVFVSVGMLEHVGKQHYKDLGRVIHSSIGDSGRGFLHFIGRDHEDSFSRWIRKRIFPGAYIPTLSQAMEVLEPWRFAVQDVENLRFHYAKTLEHWLERYDASRQQIVSRYDACFFRAWRLYLAGSVAAFRKGTLQLFQVLFTGSRCGPISWTRAPLYNESKPAIERRKWVNVMS